MKFETPKDEIEMKLDIDLFDIDFDEYKRKNNNFCYFCGFNFDDNSVNTYLHEKKKIIKTCCLCNIVSNFKIHNIEDVLIGISKLSQVEIIQKTIKYIIKNDEFPRIYDIDENAKLVNVMSYKFVKYYEKSDGKIFFLESKNIIRYFNKFLKNKLKFNLKVEKIEKEYFDKEIIDQTNLKIINQYQEHFDQQLDKTKNYIGFLTKHSFG